VLPSALRCVRGVEGGREQSVSDNPGSENKHSPHRVGFGQQHRIVERRGWLHVQVQVWLFAECIGVINGTRGGSIIRGWLMKFDQSGQE
jgi:hypothetical protein